MKRLIALCLIGFGGLPAQAQLPTNAYAEKFASGDMMVRQQVRLPNVIAIAGGLPIKAGGEVIGGAGLSGTPGVDEPCVQAGLDKVADQLK